MKVTCLYLTIYEHLHLDQGPLYQYLERAFLKGQMYIGTQVSLVIISISKVSENQDNVK